MISFLKDIRLSLRMFRRNPGFALAAVIALALGIATNIAIFSVVNTVLLQPLHAPSPDRVVAFSADEKGRNAFASEIKFNLWREQTSAFEQQSAYRFESLNLTGVDQPQRLAAAYVTGDYFRLFGLPIAQGRAFNAAELQPFGPHVVLLSDRFWRAAFGAQPQITGKIISLGGDPYQVIGVLGRDAQPEAPEPPDIWLPFRIDSTSTNQVHYFLAAGRLRPGVTLQMANAQLLVATQEFRRRYPDTISAKRGDILRVELMRNVLVNDVRSSLILLWAAVGLVLLIACANVANLLLVRASARRREMAIRVALGASRARLVRQLLTESGMLAATGAVLGLVLGIGGIRALLALNAVNLPRLGVNGANVLLDGHVAVFTILVALVTGILFGLVPALHASRLDVNSHLKEGGGRTGSGFRQSKARSLLVIGEISLALLLLVGAALLIRTLIAVRSINPGFNAQNVVVTQMTLDPKLAHVSSLDQLSQNTLQRLAALPGVDSAALSFMLPLQGNFNSMPVIVVDRPLDGPAHAFIRWMLVSHDYFDVLKIPLVSGRKFNDGDRRGAPLVAIVNQTMARQLWPHANPIGQRIWIAKGLGENFDEPPREIVGIIGDVHEDALDREPAPAAFVPVEQRPGPPANSSDMWVLVRTSSPSNPSMNSAIQNDLRQSSGGLPIPPIHSMEETVAKAASRQTFNMLLMTIFGFSALLLAAIGVYGLMAYSVQQRTREIGIRLALGAGRARVRNMVVGQGVLLILAGVLIGLTAAFALSRLIQSLLFGVKAWDPLAFIAAPILLSAVAVFSVWLPALRASRVDPIHALRHE